MEQKSAFQLLIEQQQFQLATQLLEKNIKAARLIDPRDDYTWGPESDLLGYTILAKQGAPAYVAYWQELIRFFIEDLEPAWGHLHKGHHYFRLGLGLLAVDLDRAMQTLDLSFQDDCQMAPQRTLDGLGTDVEDTQKAHPSYIALVILERLRWLEMGDYHDRFYQGLASLRFDVIYERKEVPRFKVQHALKRLIPPAQQETLISTHSQLTQVELLNMTQATFGLLGDFLWQVLACMLAKKQPPNIPDELEPNQGSGKPAYSGFLCRHLSTSRHRNYL